MWFRYFDNPSGFLSANNAWSASNQYQYMQDGLQIVQSGTRYLVTVPNGSLRIGSRLTITVFMRPSDGVRYLPTSECRVYEYAGLDDGKYFSPVGDITTGGVAGLTTMSSFRVTSTVSATFYVNTRMEFDDDQVYFWYVFVVYSPL